MSELKLIVDHLRLNYTGPFNANDLFKHITSFINELGFDLKINKEFEQNVAAGKHIEWEIEPWKKISDYVHHHIKVRVFIWDYTTSSVLIDRKKVKMGNGRLELVLDGYVEYDYYQRWEKLPMLQFIRQLMNTYIYKIYTKRFEERLIYDCNHLITSIEKLLNIDSHYKVQTEVPE